jgi:hypothetical protein
MNWNSYFTCAVISGAIGITTGLFVINSIDKQRKKSCKTKEKQETTMTVQENENVTTVENNEESVVEPNSSQFKDTAIVYDSQTGELFIGKNIANEDLANFLSIFQDPSVQNDTGTSATNIVQEDIPDKDNLVNKEHPTNQ